MLSVLCTSQGKLFKLPLDILTCLKGFFRYVKWILSTSFLPKAIYVVLLQFTYFIFQLENSLAKAQAAATGALMRRREELPHVRGQGQRGECQTATVQEQPRGATPHPRSGAEAGRTPCPKGGGQEELPHIRGRGSGRECQAATVQERPRRTTQVRGQGRWPRGATLHTRSGAVAKRSYPSPKSGAAAGRTNPTFKERWLRGHRRA